MFGKTASYGNAESRVGLYGQGSRNLARSRRSHKPSQGNNTGALPSARVVAWGREQTIESPLQFTLALREEIVEHDILHDKYWKKFILPLMFLT